MGYNMLSVIIVAFKNWRILLQTLKTMEEFNDIGDKLEVIVVDNSPEECRIFDKINKQWKYRFKYIENENKGFGYGNNAGARVAVGEFLAFINPDIIFVEPIFKRIINEFKKDTTLSMIGVRLLDVEGKNNSSFKYDFKYSVASRQIIKIFNQKGIFCEKKMYIEGADMFLRKSDFFQAGMFDENIFMYYEEADLSRRLRGMKGEHHIKFIGDLHLIHLENGSTPNSLVAIKTEIASCKYFSKKYGLSARKKLVADYRYMKFKNCIYKRLKKIEPYKEQLNIYREELLKIQ